MGEYIQRIFPRVLSIRHGCEYVEITSCPGLRPADPRKTVTTEHIRASEINGVALGLPLTLLMENAGRSIADFLECRLGHLKGRTVHIFAGKGGNGGDGLVAARHLALRGANVVVHLSHEPEQIAHSDTRLNLEVLKSMEKVKIIRPHKKGWLEVSEADAVIDALLGIGVKGELRPPISFMTEAYNGSLGLRVSIDTPTGLDPDTGYAASNSARSDVTITMGHEKRGFFAENASFYTGEVYVAEIGLMEEAEYYAGPGDVLVRIPKRPRNAHKGMGGRVLIVAGSKYFVGAPALSAYSAARTGADLVFLSSPSRIAYTAASECSTVVPRPFSSDNLGYHDVEEILGYVEKAHATVIGPGLGLDEDTIIAVESLLERMHGKPVVIDADAVKVVAKRGLKLWKEAVLTPHRGEATLLLGDQITNVEDATKRIAEKYNATVIIKGPIDVACDPEGYCRANKSGVPALAVGGTGDLLAGSIAAILARRTALQKDPAPVDSAVTAAYIIGRAGELAYGDNRESMTAYDVLEYIHKVFVESELYLK